MAALFEPLLADGDADGAAGDPVAVDGEEESSAVRSVDRNSPPLPDNSPPLQGNRIYTQIHSHSHTHIHSHSHIHIHVHIHMHILLSINPRGGVRERGVVVESQGGGVVMARKRIHPFNLPTMRLETCPSFALWGRVPLNAAMS